jgi:hypothetical protein
LEHSPEADNVDWVVILDADQIVRGPIIPWELGAEKGKPVAAYYGYGFSCNSALMIFCPFSCLIWSEVIGHDVSSSSTETVIM